MSPNLLSSDKSSLEIQLQSKSERFDYVLEQNEDFDEAKILYREIKKLRLRINEINLNCI
jgi:hypothetical protein